MKIFKKVLTVLLITCFLIPGFQGKAIVQANQSFNDVSLSGGYFHSVVSVNGEVWDWGANNLGQLGDGTITNSMSPLNATGLKNVTTAVSGFQYTMALTRSGDLYAWGQNAFGNLGDGTTDNRDTPVKVSVLSDVTAVSTRSQTSIALCSDGKVYTWGNNDCGQLGNGQTGNNSNVNIPVQVTGITNAIAVAAGTNECYAVLSDGTVKSWGDNRYGQLGDGTTISKTNPVTVSGLADVIAITAGQNFVLALKSDHTVWAWGFNAFGQLGNNSPVNAMTPVQVSSLTNITKVSAGSTHSMALKSDGSLFTWGMNMFGQVGDGTNNMSFYAPKQIYNSGVIEIGAGYNYSLALMDDGKMYAFGLNTYGALGDGTTTDSNRPVLSQLDLSGLVSKLSAPTGFDVINKSAKSITFTWDAVPGATGYDISINGIITNTGDVTTTTIEDLEPDTVHEVRIRAFNSRETSEWSDAIFVTTDADGIGDLEECYDIVDELFKISKLNGGELPDIAVNEKTGLPSFIAGKYSDKVVLSVEDAIESLKDICLVMRIGNPTDEFVEK